MEDKVSLGVIWSVIIILAAAGLLLFAGTFVMLADSTFPADFVVGVTVLALIVSIGIALLFGLKKLVERYGEEYGGGQNTVVLTTLWVFAWIVVGLTLSFLVGHVMWFGLTFLVALGPPLYLFRHAIVDDLRKIDAKLREPGELETR